MKSTWILTVGAAGIIGWIIGWGAAVPGGQAIAIQPAVADAESMQPHCRMMQQRMQQMIDRLHDMDEELRDQIAHFEEVEGEDRIDAIEEAVRTLVRQRQEIHDRQSEMMRYMMQHMGRHLTMDMPDGEARRAIENCAMMQNGGDLPVDHQQHHDEAP